MRLLGSLRLGRHLEQPQNHLRENMLQPGLLLKPGTQDLLQEETLHVLYILRPQQRLMAKLSQAKWGFVQQTHAASLC